jgi:hypothetical protein
MAAAFLAPPINRVSITMTSVPSSMMGGAVRRRSTPQQQRRYTPHSSSPPRPSKTISSSGQQYNSRFFDLCSCFPVSVELLGRLRILLLNAAMSNDKKESGKFVTAEWML